MTRVLQCAGSGPRDVMWSRIWDAVPNAVDRPGLVGDLLGQLVEGGGEARIP